MGNTASACTAVLANVDVEKAPREQSDGDFVHVQQAFTEVGHDQPADSAAAVTGIPSTFGTVKDVIQNLRATNKNIVHPATREPHPIGRPDCCLAADTTSPSAGASLHALTQSLKKNTEFIKDSVYELIREDYPDVEFVFFHGLQPDPEDTVHAFWRTWRMRFSEECWLTSLLPELLNYTEREIKPRVLSVSYGNSSKLGFKSWRASPIDQFSTSENLMTDLIMKGRGAVGQRHNVPVILVGHDLGGIMIKHFIMKVQKTLAAENLAAGMKRNLKYFWGSLSALIFYATPQVGYPTIDYKIPRNASNPSLEFLKALNKDTARVNKEFENFKLFKNLKYEIPTLRIWESAKTDQFPTEVQYIRELFSLYLASSDLESDDAKYQNVKAAGLPTPELMLKFQGRYHNELVVPRHVRGTNKNDYTALWEDHFQVCQPTGLHSFTARRFARFVVELIEVLREDEHFV